MKANDHRNEAIDQVIVGREYKGGHSLSLNDASGTQSSASLDSSV